MRFVLALGLLITLCASADAATCITLNRDMSSFVTAKVWTHCVYRESKSERSDDEVRPR